MGGLVGALFAQYFPPTQAGRPEKIWTRFPTTVSRKGWNIPGKVQKTSDHARIVPESSSRIVPGEACRVLGHACCPGPEPGALQGKRGFGFSRAPSAICTCNRSAFGCSLSVLSALRGRLGCPSRALSVAAFRRSCRVDRFCMASTTPEYDFKIFQR